MSLRNRIAIYYTIATSLLIVLIFGGILFLVDRAVSSHNDVAMMYEVTEEISNLKLKDQFFNDLAHANKFDDDGDDYKEKKRKQMNFDIDLEFIQLVDNQGNVLKKSENLFRSSSWDKSISIYFEKNVARPHLFNIFVFAGIQP